MGSSRIPFLWKALTSGSSDSILSPVVLREIIIFLIKRILQSPLKFLLEHYQQERSQLCQLEFFFVSKKKKELPEFRAWCLLNTCLSEGCAQLPNFHRSTTQPKVFPITEIPKRGFLASPKFVS